MLRREDFRRRHQHSLIAALDRFDQRQHRHRRFARAHVALDQAPHRAFAFHVLDDRFQRRLLIARQGERQRLERRRHQSTVRIVFDPELIVLRLLLDHQQPALDQK